MTRSFGCDHAEEITRRDGPDIACNSLNANNLCIELFEQLKSRALNAMDYEDDLTTLPASVLQKIQYGGLLGLQTVVDSAAQSEKVVNIVSLVGKAAEHFNSIDKIPYETCVDTIVKYKLKRRRSR